MKIGEVELEIIDIITFIGMLITFFTGVLNLFQNKKSLYINNITKFRVIWITTLRGHISSLKELSNITNLYIITKEGTDKITYRRELEKVVSLIKMYLNFTEKLDVQLIFKIDELKAIINSYLLMHYCKNTIKSVDNDNELVIKFNEAVDVISEKKVLEQLLNIAVNDKKIQEINLIESLNVLDLRNKVKSVYKDDCILIKEVIKKSDYITSQWENEIERLNRDIDELVQVYLKAEWTRCKIETRMWPLNRYNEEKVICKLQEKYKNSEKAQSKK
jgi:hypothetical protein